MQEEKLYINVEQHGFSSLEEFGNAVKFFAASGIRLSEVLKYFKQRAEHRSVQTKVSLAAYDSAGGFLADVPFAKRSGELVFLLDDERVLVKLGNASRSIRLSDLLLATQQIAGHFYGLQQARNAEQFGNSMLGGQGVVSPIPPQPSLERR